MEGTTSLSNIFRSQGLASARQINIRDLNKAQSVETDNDDITIESVYAERDRVLKIAQRTIEDEQRNIDEMRRLAAEDISAMQNAWADEKVELQQQAYEEGFQVGFGEGRDKALSDMASSIQLANEVTEKSYKNAEQYQTSQERVILELAMRVATRIVGEEIEGDDEKFLSVVRRALKEAREMTEIKLYVSIDYFKLVSDNRAELASIFPPDVPFLIFANEEFESTECYIETNHGRIVVSVDDQLNELREQLIEILESGD